MKTYLRKSLGNVMNTAGNMLMIMSPQPERIIYGSE